MVCEKGYEETPTVELIKTGHMFDRMKKAISKKQTIVPPPMALLMKEFGVQLPNIQVDLKAPAPIAS